MHASTRRQPLVQDAMDACLHCAFNPIALCQIRCLMCRLVSRLWLSMLTGTARGAGPRCVSSGGRVAGRRPATAGRAAAADAVRPHVPAAERAAAAGRAQPCRTGAHLHELTAFSRQQVLLVVNVAAVTPAEFLPTSDRCFSGGICVRPPSTTHAVNSGLSFLVTLRP